MWIKSFCFIFFIFNISSSTKADESNLREKIETSKSTFSVLPSYSTVKGTTTSLSAISLGGEYSYGLSKNWGLGAGLTQAFALSTGLSPYFTRVDLKMSYAITGSFIREEKTLFVGSYDVVKRYTSNQNSILFDLYLTEYLFAGSTSLVPYSGIGFQLRYIIPTIYSFNYTIGGRYDSITNGTLKFTAMQFHAGLVFLM